jgi:hypothetical protein
LTLRCAEYRWRFLSLKSVVVLMTIKPGKSNLLCAKYYLRFFWQKKPKMSTCLEESWILSKYRPSNEGIVGLMIFLLSRKTLFWFAEDSFCPTFGEADPGGLGACPQKTTSLMLCPKPRQEYLVVQ